MRGHIFPHSAQVDPIIAQREHDELPEPVEHPPVNARHLVVFDGERKQITDPAEGPVLDTGDAVPVEPHDDHVHAVETARRQSGDRRVVQLEDGQLLSRQTGHFRERAVAAHEVSGRLVLKGALRRQGVLAVIEPRRVRRARVEQVVPKDVRPVRVRQRRRQIALVAVSTRRRIDTARRRRLTRRLDEGVESGEPRDELFDARRTAHVRVSGPGEVRRRKDVAVIAVDEEAEGAGRAHAVRGEGSARRGPRYAHEAVESEPRGQSAVVEPHAAPILCVLRDEPQRSIALFFVNVSTPARDRGAQREREPERHREQPDEVLHRAVPRAIHRSTRAPVGAEKLVIREMRIPIRIRHRV